MRFKLISIVLILFFIPLLSSSAIFNGGGGGFHIGYHLLNINSLNGEIVDGGYDALSDKRIFLGGGGYGIFWKGILVGGEGGGILPMSSENNSNNLNFIGGYGLFDAGFAIIRRPNFILYPMVGFGRYTALLEITPSSGDYDFDDFIGNPYRMTSLDCKGFLLSIQGGFDYIINFSNDPEAVGGLMIGFRAGYLYPLGDTKWQMGDIEVENAPETPFKGFFFNLVIGGFGGETP